METQSGNVRIVEGMSFEEYAAAPGINASLLCAVDELSLEEAKAQMDGEMEFYSDALDFGKALHSLWLEGKTEFETQPAVYPSADGSEKPWNNNANFCKSWTAGVESVGKVVLTEKEAAAVRGMVSKLNDHRELQDVRGRSELSIFVEKDGIPLKIRVDTLPMDPCAPVYDLKSCRRANPEAFMRSAWDLRYHIKAAFYLDVLHLAGIHRDCFTFIACRKDAPFSISLIEMRDEPDSLIRTGRFLYRSAYRKIVEAMKTGRWPSYETSQAEQHIQPWIIKIISDERCQLEPARA